VILDFGGSVPIDESTFRRMVPLGGALHLLVLIGRILGS
jgi:hypothetical protein